MKYRWGKKPSQALIGAQRRSRADSVSMLDTKTGGPMGVLDGEDLKTSGKRDSNQG